MSEPTKAAYWIHHGLTAWKWRKLRLQALARDKYICQVCGLNPGQQSQPPIVHHIDYDTSHNELDNLVVLCRRCHRQVHSGLYQNVLPIIEDKWAYVRKWGGRLELAERLKSYYYLDDPQIRAFLMWRSLKLVNA